MALNTRKSVEEVQSILEAMHFFKKVGIGRIEDLVAEQNFPSIYISYDADLNENNGKMRNDGGEYDRVLILTLHIHLDLSTDDELYYLNVRDMVEEAILKDNLLWQSVIDRDVVGSKWDKGQNLPKKQGEMSITLFTRGTC